MNIARVSGSGNARALVLFAGWGMDERPFEGLNKAGYDIFVIWDYRTDTLDLAALGHYSELCVVAWSWGVLPAARFLVSGHGLPVTLAVAVNGTLHPVDDRHGIPYDIFQGTHDSLDPRRLLKFYRRMMPDAASMERFKAVMPHREIEDLKEELRAIAAMSVPEGVEERRLAAQFDAVVLSRGDAIIPYDNQRNAWEGIAACESVDGAHYPDFAAIIDRWLVEKELVRQKFSDAASTYPSESAPQQAIARRLMELWEAQNPMPGGAVVEVGVGTGYFTSLYSQRLHPSSLRLWDLYESSTGVEACDAETAIRSLPDESVDVVAGASAVQWFNSLNAFFAETVRVLRPGGFGVFSTFAPDHFEALNRITGRSLNFPAVVRIEGVEWLADVTETLPVTFSSPAQMLRHLKLSGVNSLMSGPEAAVGARRILRDYPRDPDGRVTLVYRPHYIIFRKKPCR